MISRMLGSEIHIRDFNGIIATINNFRTRNKVANDLPHSESCTNDYSQVNTGYPHVGEGRPHLVANVRKQKVSRN